MTRFQSRALPAYKPQPYQSGLAGLMTAYGMWQSLSPETRDKIASLFQQKDGDVVMYNPALETRIAPSIPDIGTNAAHVASLESMLGPDDSEMPLTWELLYGD